MNDANVLIKKDFFSLRSTLEWLKDEKLLIETDKEVCALYPLASSNLLVFSA